MSSVKPFNLQDFESNLVNGDPLLDFEIQDPVRTRSDFDITTPNIKVDPLIQNAIDIVTNTITSSVIETVPSMEKKVKDLIAEEKVITDRLADLKKELDNCNRWLADAKKRMDPKEKDQCDSKEEEVRQILEKIDKAKIGRAHV